MITSIRWHVKQSLDISSLLLFGMERHVRGYESTEIGVSR